MYISSLPEGYLSEITDLVQGNPYALNVMDLIMREHTDKLMGMIQKLKRYNIKGNHIWMIYQRKCNQNIDSFLEFHFENRL